MTIRARDTGSVIVVECDDPREILGWLPDGTHVGLKRVMFAPTGTLIDSLYAVMDMRHRELLGGPGDHVQSGEGASMARPPSPPARNGGPS